MSKTLGIIGGIGPESTVQYYRSIVAGYRKRVTDGSYPQILINSIDLQVMLEHVAAGRLDELVTYLAAHVERLANAQADLGLLAANTPHLVFDRLAERSRLPLISIVDAACAATREIGAGKPLLLGTRFTMQADFYRARFARAGITVISPLVADQERVQAIYVDELLGGVFLPQSRNELEAIIRRMKAEAGIDAVLLAGTELSLLMREESYEDVPVVDSTRAHIEMALSALLS